MINHFLQSKQKIWNFKFTTTHEEINLELKDCIPCLLPENPKLFVILVIGPAALEHKGHRHSVVGAPQCAHSTRHHGNNRSKHCRQFWCFTRVGKQWIIVGTHHMEEIWLRSTSIGGQECIPKQFKAETVVWIIPFSIMMSYHFTISCICIG